MVEYLEENRRFKKLGTKARIILKYILNKRCVGHGHGFDYSGPEKGLVVVFSKTVMDLQV
jgi:hypothetical protein